MNRAQRMKTFRARVRPSSSAAVPPPAHVRLGVVARFAEFVREWNIIPLMVFQLFLGFMFVQATPSVVQAMNWTVPPGLFPTTTRPIKIMKTPPAQLSLVQNVVTLVAGVYCNVTVWNNSNTPVYFGGPSNATGFVVNATNGMPLCNDASVCRDSVTSINVDSNGLALLQTASVAPISVRYLLGEGCSNP